MLLTVIAVATLLVAVVGATFAYFSLSVSGNATTTANVTAGSVGTVEYSAVNGNLVLAVSAQDMAQGLESDKPYYAVIGTHSDGKFEHGTDATPVEIAQVVLDGAASTDTYTCDATLTVTAKGTMIGKTIEDVPKALLQKGWLTLSITGDEGLSTAVPEISSIDLADFVTENATAVDTGHTETYEISNFTLKGTNQTKKLKALLTLTNKQDEDQSAIAGKSVEVTIKLAPKSVEEGSSCTITSAATD